MTPAEGVVTRFVAAFIAGRVNDLASHLAVDVDRDDVVHKTTTFRQRFAGLSTVLHSVAEQSGQVVAQWTTFFPDGSSTQWRGTFVVANDHITRFEVDHVA
jgi:hypothetical protein